MAAPDFSTSSSVILSLLHTLKDLTVQQILFSNEGKATHRKPCGAPCSNNVGLIIIMSGVSVSRP